MLVLTCVVGKLIKATIFTEAQILPMIMSSMHEGRPHPGSSECICRLQIGDLAFQKYLCKQWHNSSFMKFCRGPVPALQINQRHSHLKAGWCWVHAQLSWQQQVTSMGCKVLPCLKLACCRSEQAAEDDAEVTRKYQRPSGNSHSNKRAANYGSSKTQELLSDP